MTTDKKEWQQFVQLLQVANEENMLDKTLTFLLTFEEREQIAKRVSITKALLGSELSQREIAAAQKISISKITRGSNQLKQVSEKMKVFLKDQLLK